MCRHPTVQQEVNNLHGAHTQEPSVSSADRILYGWVGIEQVVVQLEWLEMTGTCVVQGRSPLPDVWS